MIFFLFHFSKCVAVRFLINHTTSAAFTDVCIRMCALIDTYRLSVKVLFDIPGTTKGPVWNIL
jgi:hypothetical protein